MVEGRTKTPELRDMEYDEREDADLEAEVYKNIHDLIGVKGVIRKQQIEVEKKKVGGNPHPLPLANN